MKLVVNNMDSDFYVRVVIKAINNNIPKKVTVYQEKNIVERRISPEMLVNVVNVVNDIDYQFVEIFLIKILPWQ